MSGNARRLTGALLLAAFLLGGCAEQSSREIVVSDSLLIEVLADLHLADARARLPGEPVGLRDSVLVHHGLDEDVFSNAMDGFVERPEELTALYNSVLDRLNAERTP
ncbi:MAG: DUF4296 domain-containing protein [Rhodothermales bacterium]|nr:DUF4296 domain-containing protein [Rhodothermales bacterium]MBO6779659.1 DUF4296 domain-containing protein [Rhodothermales bacterium]